MSGQPRAALSGAAKKREERTKWEGKKERKRKKDKEKDRDRVKESSLGYALWLLLKKVT